ncbi:hypothetical protein QBC47DRAFT_350258 [Echria macrotheca]|uniref:Phosphoglycerate mutase n=1 Tax=Echria macrotheca TaxID=438768 RepID=A0AAJ0B8M5_9PEZI|nr:hypothetical protein QBC47DRAFT_350258 [Echria macrotheca]
MGHPPAFLFVIRRVQHGLRLDVADKQWHLTSPTPYDPPLSYVGWQQAKNLGARIGSIIRERIAEEEAANTQTERKRKRYKVVLHSSPFLRCIQTAIAISAGLAQDSTPFGSDVPERRTPSPPVLSPRSRPTIPDTPEVKSIPIRKSVLRLDAFLGEWLNPGYFEKITTPPESVMMLAGAKADLLRREDYNSYPNFSARPHSNSQGHLWTPTRTSSTSTNADPFDTMSSLAGSLQSTGSLSSLGSSSRHASISAPSDSSGYVSPVPHWAVNNNNTIPPGYVAHARDACVDIDYQWDSMQKPLEWGDGGSYPEEWTEMHKRLRKGIQHLVDWYSTTENPTDMVTKTVPRAKKPSIDVMSDLSGDDEDIETEAIVIMVSHGAGCNALIGAITHQPVLTEVAMASLTMAVRKPASQIPDASQAVHHRGWASPETKKDSVPVHLLYDLKIFVNTDHLRSTPPTPAATRSPSVASGMNAPRTRFSSSLTSTLGNFTFHDGSNERRSSMSAALGGFGRSEAPSRLPYSISSGSSKGGITVGSGMTSFAPTKPSSLARTASVGLWSPIGTQGSLFEDEDDDDDDGMLLNFSHEKLAPVDLTPQIKTPRPVKAEGYFDLPVSEKSPDDVTPSPIALPDMAKDESSEEEAGSAGLWGGPKAPDDADRLRDTSSAKRRWTVTEHT